MNDSSPSLSQTSSVSLVIPGKNCAGTLDKCLKSVVPLLEQGDLQEILFVDDGSTDNTAEIARRYPVQVITGTGSGPGAARNLGWRQAQGEYIWFIDSDCVAEPDALQRLILHLNNPEVAGVGGSYANLYPDSLLATLIHEEIIARHRRMTAEVDFLGGFNVLYRRTALELVNGFDECDMNGPQSPGAEDCDLSFRLHQRGFSLRFERNSIVGHHHPRFLYRYLQSQRIHGHWRVRLYRRHIEQMSGDSYSSLVDHLQPFSGLIAIFSLPFLLFSPQVTFVTVLLCGVVNLYCGLVVLHRTLLSSTESKCDFMLPSKLLLMCGFVAMSSIRSLWRGIGILSGLLSCVTRPPQMLSLQSGATQPCEASDTTMNPVKSNCEEIVK